MKGTSQGQWCVNCQFSNFWQSRDLRCTNCKDASTQQGAIVRNQSARSSCLAVVEGILSVEYLTKAESLLFALVVRIVSWHPIQQSQKLVLLVLWALNLCRKNCLDLFLRRSWYSRTIKTTIFVISSNAEATMFPGLFAFTTPLSIIKLWFWVDLKRLVVCSKSRKL